MSERLSCCALSAMGGSYSTLFDGSGCDELKPRCCVVVIAAGIDESAVGCHSALKSRVCFVLPGGDEPSALSLISPPVLPYQARQLCMNPEMAAVGESEHGDPALIKGREPTLRVAGEAASEVDAYLIVLGGNEAEVAFKVNLSACEFEDSTIGVGAKNARCFGSPQQSLRIGPGVVRPCRHNCVRAYMRMRRRRIPTVGVAHSGPQHRRVAYRYCHGSATVHDYRGQDVMPRWPAAPRRRPTCLSG